MINSQHYTYRILWSEEDQEYVGLCAEFPSLSCLDENQDEALRGIRDLVRAVVADMIMANEPIPEPLSEKQYSGKFQVRMPPDLHRQLVIRAAEENMSLNRYINHKLTFD